MLKKTIAIIASVSTATVATAVAVPLGVILTQKAEESKVQETAATPKAALTVPYGTTKDELLAIVQKNHPGAASASLLSSDYGPGTVAGSRQLNLVFSVTSAATGKTELVRYAVTVAPKQLPMYQKTVTVELPYGTTDVPPVAKPADLSEGAMLDMNVTWNDGHGMAINKPNFATLSVGSSVTAQYAVVPINANYTGAMGTYDVVYTIVKAEAQDGMPITWNDTLPYGTAVLPVLGADRLPTLPRGHARWGNPAYSLSDGSPLTAEALATLPVGRTFKVTYSSILDSNHVGSPATITATYTITASPTGVFEGGAHVDTTTLVWGSIEALPSPAPGTAELPSVPEGYQPWSAAKYSASLDEVKSMAAGTSITLTWTSAPDANHVGPAITWTATYFIAKAKATPPVIKPRNHTLDRGSVVFPTDNAPPEQPDGYQPWGEPVFTSGKTPITSWAQMAALQPDDVLTATYKAKVDGNHEGPDATYVHYYVIVIPRAAAGYDTSYEDTESFVYGSTEYPNTYVGSKALPLPGQGWYWSEPNYSINKANLPILNVGTVFTAVYWTVLLPQYVGMTFSRTITYVVQPRRVAAGPFLGLSGGYIGSLVAPPDEALPKLPVGYTAWRFTGWSTDKEGKIPLDTTKNPPRGTPVYRQWTADVLPGYVGKSTYFTALYVFRQY